MQSHPWEIVADPRLQKKKYILGDACKGIKTISSFKELMNSGALMSEIGPKRIREAIVEINWIEVRGAIQFKVNEVWDLVPHP